LIRKLRYVGVMALTIGSLLAVSFVFARMAPGVYQRLNDLTGGAFNTNGLIGLLGLMLALAGLHGKSPPRAERERLADAVARMVEDLNRQWTSQPQGQQLGDFHPLRVEWLTTDGSVSDDLASMLGVQTDRIGLFQQDSDNATASGSWDDVVTAGFGLSDTSGRAPGGRRLLIVGEAGAGKTVLAQYVAQALNHRLSKPDAPGSGKVMVPVSMADWDPGDETRPAATLFGWIARRLVEQYPYVGQAVPPPDASKGAGIEGTVAYRLLKAGRLMPVLDGLDEIPMPLRSEAIAKINELVPENVFLVITCRAEEYWEATQEPRAGPDDVPTGVLTRTAVARLLPFTAEEVRAYLSKRASVVSPTGAHRWEPILANLTGDPSGSLASSLSKPLMAFLSASVYAGSRDPGEMLSIAADGGLERHLLNLFIPTAFRRSRWRDDKQVRSWLTFLATDLNARNEQRIAWWTLGSSHRLATGLLVGIAVGLVTWLAAGLSLGFGLGKGAGFGLPVGLLAGVLVGNILGIGFGIACGARTLPPTNLEFRVRRRLWEALFGGLFVGGATGVIFGIFFGTGNGIFSGALLGAPIAAGYGAFGQARDTASPTALLRRDRWFVVAFVLAYGIPWTIIASLYFGGPAVGIPSGVAIGLVGGTVNGIQYAMAKKWDQFGAVAWFRLALIRPYFAIRGDLPWRVMTFLKDAYRVGVLRQDGGYYQFRHAQLRDQLISEGRYGPVGR
jgi:hypothetical protein